MIAEAPQTEPVVEERAKLINWYRSPVPPDEMRKLYERSDVKGLAQTLGYLGVLIAIAAAVLYSQHHWPWYATVGLIFLYGTCFSFQINAVHEIGHLTVFKTRALSNFFVHLFAFLGWINHRWFDASHTRHHRSTLHQPDDLEVVLPIKFTVKDFFKSAFINPQGIPFVLKNTYRIATGRFAGEWELKMFPPSQPEKSKPTRDWAWTLLYGHAAIVIVCVAVTLLTHFRVNLLLVPVLTTFAIFYGNWLLFLCNNTQHVGLRDDVADFRLCCRTFVPNPFVRFLYWHMNYHTEHHMYVGVPCYNLAKLHKLIESDLPPTPHSIIQCWREIAAILIKQKADPTYQYTAPVPNPHIEDTPLTA